MSFTTLRVCVCVCVCMCVCLVLQLRMSDDMQFSFSYFYYLMGEMKTPDLEKFYHELDVDNSG